MTFPINSLSDSRTNFAYRSSSFSSSGGVIDSSSRYLYKCAYFPGAPPPQTIAAPPDLEGGDNAFNADDVGSGEAGFGTFQDESNGADVIRDFC